MSNLIINGIDHSQFDLEWAKRGGVVFAQKIREVGCYVQWPRSKTGYAVLTKDSRGHSMLWFAEIDTETTIDFASIFRMATPDECAAAGVEYMAPPMRWLPIESASMDGTLILLYTDSGAITVGQFDSLLKYWRYDYDNADGHDKPTHWMSLPQPPVTLSKSGSNE